MVEDPGRRTNDQLSIRGSGRRRSTADSWTTVVAFTRRRPRLVMAGSAVVAAVLFLQVLLVRTTIVPALDLRQRTEVQPVAMLLQELWMLEGMPESVARMCESAPALDPDGASVDLTFAEVEPLFSGRARDALTDLQARGQTLDAEWTVRYRCDPTVIELLNEAGDRYWPPETRRWP